MKPQQGSHAAVVIDKLLEYLAAENEAGKSLAGVQILDGPAVADEDQEDDALWVAPGDPDSPGAFTQRTPEPALGRRAYRTRTEVVMLLTSYSGETDMQPRRERVVAMFNAVKAIVDDHQVETGCWDQLYMGADEQMTPAQSRRGAVCAIGFTIVAESTG